MPRNPNIPRPDTRELSKSVLLTVLKQVDDSDEARERVLAMETDFRTRIVSHIESLPEASAPLAAFNTSPFVLLVSALMGGHTQVSELEGEFVTAKAYSSIETSVGRMIEEVTLPVYGWELVVSEMQTANSALDGRKPGEGVATVATLKSGPRTLNDEMAENFADAVIANAKAWAEEGGHDSVEFTYGALYGTPKQSNKKDWHILRNLEDKLTADQVLESPKDRWFGKFLIDDVPVVATVRSGLDWWMYLGGETCLVEVLTSLIRACVTPGEPDEPDHKYRVSDLGEIVGLGPLNDDYNVSLLQRSQIPWFFLMARHFCDDLTA